jgi:drug/metabolite transporter (DMT)-like permease
MSYWHGVLWSVAAACAHTAVDVLRKYGSGRIPPGDIVALVAVFDAVIATTAVGLVEGYSMDFADPELFLCLVFASSLLGLLAKYMYQKALHIAPLSLTVPYLAFTPALLVVVAFLFLGEVPTTMGLFGVSIVTLSGYLLGLKCGPPAVPPGSPSKERAPDMPSHFPWQQQQLKVAEAKTVWALTFYKDRQYALKSELQHQKQFQEQQQQQQPSPGRHLITVEAPYDTTTNSTNSSSSSTRRPLLQPSSIKQRPGLPLNLTPPPQRLGPVMILAVAAVWSVTASLDKMGTMAAPSTSIYFVTQRVIIGAAGFTYLLLFSRPSFKYCCSHFGLLCSISLAEQAAVGFFLLAIKDLLVSYVVAIKRINALLSTLLACVLFKERVAHRLPYILGMIVGCLIIVLQPGHEFLHHSHHTKHFL